MDDVIDVIPFCCGQEATRESWQLFSCRKCNGEISFNFEEDSWDYDCPWATPPRRDLG